MNSFEKIKPIEKKKQKSLDTLKDVSFEILEQYIEKIDFSTEEFLECLKGKVERGTSIGSGQCADVYMFSPEDGFGSVCVKKIKEYPTVKINDIDQESYFHQQVKEMNIRVPSLLFQIKHGNEKYIAMERIDGFSIKDAESDSKLLRELSDFSLENFFQKLHDYIKKMNTEGIYHRDLHGGNVMIERGTQEPVIIDFGSADMFFGGDEEFEIYTPYAQKLINEEAVIKGEKGVYRRERGVLLKDMNQVDTLKKKVRDIL